jgi:hypothetical protein
MFSEVAWVAIGQIAVALKTLTGIWFLREGLPPPVQFRVPVQDHLKSSPLWSEGWGVPQIDPLSTRGTVKCFAKRLHARLGI